MAFTVFQHYRQGMDNRLKADSITKEGICWAASIYWLVSKHKCGLGSRAFWTALMQVRKNTVDASHIWYRCNQHSPTSPESAIYKAMDYQNRTQSYKGESSNFEAVTKFMEQAAPKLNLATKKISGLSAKFFDGPGMALPAFGPSEDKIIDWLTRYYSGNGGRMYFHHMTFKHKGGYHAVASAYKQNGDIHFLDVNSAEYKATNLASFKQAMKPYLKQYGIHHIATTTFHE